MVVLLVVVDFVEVVESVVVDVVIVVRDVDAVVAVDVIISLKSGFSVLPARKRNVSKIICPYHVLNVSSPKHYSR